MGNSLFWTLRSVSVVFLLCVFAVACGPGGDPEVNDANGIVDGDGDVDGDLDGEGDLDGDGDVDGDPDGDGDGDNDGDGDTDGDGDGELDEGPTDYLLVIDNSGSMCHVLEQKRAGLDSFLETLIEKDVDFHIGVTTGHMDESYPLEPVARPGHLQSTPQPVPGLMRACQFGLDEFGGPDFDDVSPVLAAIETAVSCTEDPAAWESYLTPDLDALRCALDPVQFPCDNPENIESFFPNDYRDLPTVLRAADYRNQDGALDAEALRRDFRCATHVGNRGHGYVKALSAAVLAVSEEMLSGPNDGFLRPDAQTSVMFVTNSLDCSHDGSLDERSICTILECILEELEGEDGAMLSTSELRRQFLYNLALARELAVDSDATEAQLQELLGDSVFARSFHGPYEDISQYAGTQCTMEATVQPTCNPPEAFAWSGHRFAEFVSGFSNFSTDDINEVPALICEGFDDAF